MTDATPTGTETKTNSEGQGFLKRLKAGDYGLAMTFWVYAFILPMIVGFAFASVGGVFITIVINIISIIYGVFYCLPGIWNASKNYKGPSVWAILAKVLVVFSVLAYVMMALSLLIGGVAIIAA